MAKMARKTNHAVKKGRCKHEAKKGTTHYCEDRQARVSKCSRCGATFETPTPTKIAPKRRKKKKG